MDGFTVDIEPLVTASSAAARVAEDAGRADLRGALQALGAGMRGSATERALARIGVDWPAVLTALAGSAAGHADAMAASARAYRDVESDIRRRMSG